MRKLLCLSLCSVHRDQDLSQASEQSILRVASTSRRVRRETYIRPSSRAICLSSVLLSRFPSAFPILNSQGTDSVEIWKRQYQTDESFSSTPFSLWADALPVKFNSIWNLLAFESNGALSTELPWRSPEQEFWMPKSSVSSVSSYSRDNQQNPSGFHDYPVLSEGICRTMMVVTSICQDSDMRQSLLGSMQSRDSWNSILKLIFSFCTPLDELDSGVRSTRYQRFFDEEPDTRLRTSEELLLLVSNLSDRQLLDYIEHNSTKLPIFEECLGEWLRTIDQESLSTFCETRVKYSSTFLNSVSDLVHYLCDETINGRPRLRLSDDNPVDVVFELVSISFNSKKKVDRASDRNPLAMGNTLALWYKTLWLKFYLLRSLLPLSLEPGKDTWAILLEETTELENIVVDKVEAEETSKLVSTRELRPEKNQGQDPLPQLSRLFQDTLLLKAALQMQGRMNG